MATAPPPLLTAAPLLLLLSLLLLTTPSATSYRPWPKPNSPNSLYAGSKKYEGSSDFVHLKYHSGPLLTSNITIHPIWYGTWQTSQKKIIREFINSISAQSPPPSLSAWWKTINLYTDKSGANVSRYVTLGAEKSDRFYAHGKALTRLTVPSIIHSAVTARTKPLPINTNSAIYLVLTADDVYVDDFCINVCGFHHFTTPAPNSPSLPYAWIGNSGKLCPSVCAYPFSVPVGFPTQAVKSPNGDVGVDGMISVIAHELAEIATDPFSTGWYAGDNADFPVEIGDLCEGIYGTGGGGSYTGQMLNDGDGATYNVNGIRRRFLVQWVWNRVVSYCAGPNALDQ